MCRVEIFVVSPMEPRSRRRNVVAHENGEVSTSLVEDDLDPWTAWAYRPRTISLLLVGACLLM